MRSPSDLPTPRQAEYRERKRQIALARCEVVNALMDARAAEERGDLTVAMQAAVCASMFCDDLTALLEAWIEDYPPDAPTPFSQVAST